jgi:ribosomal protein S18 acetylase RimI-like enzyme
MTATYRDATPVDAATLDGVFDSSFCDTFAHLYRPEDLQAFLSSFGVADWESQLGDPAYAFHLAEVDGKAVGYVKLGPMKLPIEVHRPAILLDQIYILTGYHGVGIAHGLMDWAIDEARRRGAEELYLTVYIENHRARRFYDRYGFEDVGRYEFKVGNHVDEDVIMRKSL